MLNKRCNKKGNSQIDMVFILLLLLFLFLFGGLALFLLGTANNVIQDNAIFPQQAKDYGATLEDKAPKTIDLILTFGLFVLFLGLFLSAWFLDNYPAFFIVLMALTIIGIFIGLPVVNIVYDVTQDGTFAPFFAEMPMFMFFVQNWFWVIIFYLSGIIFALIAKGNFQGGGQI